MIRVSLPILIALWFLQMGCSQPKEPLVLATYTYSSNDRIAHLMPLADELEKALKRSVKVKSYADVESFVKGIKSNQVDIALINTLGYLTLARDNQHMIPIAALKITNDAVDNYKTVLLTKAAETANLDSLKENSSLLSMTFVKKGSTSGNLVPRLLLSALGITSPERAFGKVNYGGDHRSTFNLLVEGETDVCAIGSNEYFKQIHKDSTLLNKCRLVWMSEEIPLGPVLINRKLSPSDQEKIKDLILNLHLDHMDVLQSIKNGWSEALQTNKFYAIEDSYYDSFRSINGNPTDLFNILDALED